MRCHPRISAAGRAAVQGALTSIALVLACASVARADAFGSVRRAYQAHGGAVPACAFSSARLTAAVKAMPPDLAQYTDFPDAVQQALTARAAGACRRHHHRVHGAVAGAARSAAGGPGGHVPGPPVPVGPATTLTNEGVPAAVALFIVLGAVAALVVGTITGTARLRRRHPEWAAVVYRPFAAALAVGVSAATATRPPPGPARGAHAAAPRAPAPAGASRARRRRGLRALLALLAVAGAATAALILVAPPAPYSKAQESIFQDDDHLLYSPTATVERTLRTLARLGVNRVRLTVKWAALAPGAQSPVKPAFEATNPGAYPPAAWVPYDRVVRLARARGISVDFNVTAPGPLWAMGTAPAARVAGVYTPAIADFGNFLAALGRRYSGRYVPPGARAPLPRVDYWSIWNEPNQAAWLAPQWRTVAGRAIPESPWLYRALVGEATIALAATGHTFASDTILIGELAPIGSHIPSWHSPMTPLEFLKRLYCVDDGYVPLQGTLAAAVGCPMSGDPAQFVRENPALFDATGFAHHPYDLYHPPSYWPSDPDEVTMSSLERLTGALDAIFSNYGVHRQMPLYLTEYGYETDPPNPNQVVSPAQQAAYIGEADYLAWSNPRVRSLAQFLLFDSLPDPRYPPGSYKHWDTFQSGLLYANGRRKPAYAAYSLPIWLPETDAGGGVAVPVWGQVRAAAAGSEQRVLVQWRSRRVYRTIATAIVRDRGGYFETSVRPPASGRVRLAWRSPTGRLHVSIPIAVRVS
jgi:hypothetical protein